METTIAKQTIEKPRELKSRIESNATEDVAEILECVTLEESDETAVRKLISDANAMAQMIVMLIGACEGNERLKREAVELSVRTSVNVLYFA